jgi:hypothetical protein
MLAVAQLTEVFPRALSTYPDQPHAPLFALLVERVRVEPFNAIATAIFLPAIVHTFSAARFTTCVVQGAVTGGGPDSDC